MAFPSPSVSTPALSPYQLWFNALTLGTGASGVNFKEIDGLDLEGMRSGDPSRARDHGQFTGLDLLGARDITVTLDVSSSGSTTFAQAMQALAAATVPAGYTETPLFVAMPWGTYVCMARPRARSYKIDIAFALGNIAQDNHLQFHATDPRFYSTPTLNPSVGLAAPGSGFHFNIGFNLSFGGAVTPNAITINNLGNINCSPILVITGPCTNPAVTNGSVAGNPTLTFNLTMNAGDQLVIDTDLHTATYYVAGSTQGSSQLAALAAGSTWWTLAPGTSLVQFNSSDVSSVAATLTVEWASAYLL